MKILGISIKGWIKMIAVMLIVLVLGMLYAKWKGLPSFSSWLAAKPVVIDETPLVISEIKKIAELHTAKLYCEVVADSTVISSAEAAIMAVKGVLPFMPIPSADFTGSKKIVLVAKGKVIAGIDLAQLSEKDIIVKKDSVWVTLPSSKVLDIITNPSDFEVFLEEGTWNPAELAMVKQKAVRQMLEEAQKRQLTVQANERAQLLMEKFLKSTGFSYVKIQQIN
jgi:hypothetical protein